MGETGVWVVYFWDNYPIVISIWNDELEARRAECLHSHYEIIFIKFGEDFREVVKCAS